CPSVVNTSHELRRSCRAMRTKYLGVFVAVMLVVSACGATSQPSSSQAPSGSAAAAGPTGPIKIWYSNNKEEVAWGKAVVDGWNKDHPNEQVTGEEIPAGTSSEEVIGASITAGNTPCLIFNTAPAA